MNNVIPPQMVHSYILIFFFTWFIHLPYIVEVIHLFSHIIFSLHDSFFSNQMIHLCSHVTVARHISRDFFFLWLFTHHVKKKKAAQWHRKLLLFTCLFPPSTSNQTGHSQSSLNIISHLHHITEALWLAVAPAEWLNAIKKCEFFLMPRTLPALTTALALDRTGKLFSVEMEF